MCVGGGPIRDPNLTNLDKGIPELNANSETDGKRKVLRTISIRFGCILISGSGGFTEYIAWEANAGSMFIDTGVIKRLIYVWKLQKWAIRISES